MLIQAIIFLTVFTVAAHAEQRFNPITGMYETVLPETDPVLRFNAPEGTWTYAPRDADLELNRSTLRWEYPGQSRAMPPDPVPYEFRQGMWDRELRARERGRYR